jgi:hypothetical protein
MAHLNRPSTTESAPHGARATNEGELRHLAFVSAAMLVLCGVGLAQGAPSNEPAAAGAGTEKGKEKESPWLVVPTFSVNPKLGASVGVMAAYLHYFDEESRPSMFGIGAQYTSTDSVIASLFARASWDRDHQRVIGLVAAGNIKNDYDDYLGTGVPLKTNDELSAFVTRYLYRVYGDWFIGVQGAYTNYQLLGDSSFDDQVLDVLGLQGFKSGGIGASIYHDSRDNENSPTHGFMMNLNNIAYREWIAGENDFDVYRADTRIFFPQTGEHVLAVRQFNQFTVDAPAGAFAPVQLRGYKMGQYLAQNMSSLEVEERLHLSERWTATAFAGVAFLYGDTPAGIDSYDPFPAVGAGVQYVLKPKEGIVLNLEAALGRDDNYGIFIKMGYGW